MTILTVATHSEERGAGYTLRISKENTHTHTQRNPGIPSEIFLSDGMSPSVCMCVCVCVCVCTCITAWSFRWLMEMFSYLRYYICSPGTARLLPSDLLPDDIPVWPASSLFHDEWDSLIYIIHCEKRRKERKPA